MLTGEFELGPHDVTADSVPSLPHLGNPAMATLAALAQLKLDAAAANSEQSQKTATLAESLPTNAPAGDVAHDDPASPRRGKPGHDNHVAGCGQ